MITEKSPYVVASVDRALSLLQLLEKEKNELGVTEISKQLGVQKSTAHSLLQTLLARGFVEQTENGKYTLGVRLVQLGNAYLERMDIRKIARPLMVELADQTEEIALLAMRLRDELIIIDKVEPQRPFLVIPKIDFTAAFHSTAVGKVLLACAPPEMITGILGKGLKRFTPFTLVAAESISRELDKVRMQGYAIGCNETIEGITCIAVPVFDAGGKVAAALSITSSSSMVNAGRYEEVIKMLQAKAGAISARLGYH